jgi:hypothetical protein
VAIAIHSAHALFFLLYRHEKIADEDEQAACHGLRGGDFHSRNDATVAHRRRQYTKASKDAMFILLDNNALLRSDTAMDMGASVVQTNRAGTGTVR